jgi:hypothetical protein
MDLVPVYIFVDVEAAGPVPAIYSMLLYRRSCGG